MSYSTEQNKEIVRRFNKECIEQGLAASFEELLADDVVNHAAAPGRPNGKESFSLFLNGVLREGFPDCKVEILDQVAENDLVSTRKKITGTHTGEIMGIAPTNKSVVINVIDIIRLKDGKYKEHWGQTDFHEVIRSL
ncbi:MAG: ester cyclase [Bacteroidetes bacterium]|nr:ester cyclase [Bacteroidota bacterium]